jgi:hypothetical protein
MVVHQFEEFVELNLRELKNYSLPSVLNIVLSDLQITKTHDSLPIALFRFTRLASVVNASVADSHATRKYCPWPDFFLFNEALSHPRVGTLMRLTWLKGAYCYFMICRETLRKERPPQHITEYGCREDSSNRRYLFDSKIL